MPKQNEIDNSAKARKKRAAARVALASPGAAVDDSFYTLVNDINADLRTPAVKLLIANLQALTVQAIAIRPSAAIHTEAALRGLAGLTRDLSLVTKPVPSKK